jgi:phage-related minor tail protein
MIVADLFARLGLLPDEKSFDKGKELIESVHHALEAYLGFEGLKKVGELVEGTVEAAVQAKHLGERLGITGEAVQELGYAADVTGASAEDMTSAMQRLSQGMERAAKTGKGPLVDALGHLHLSFSKIKGQTRDVQLETIADGFKNAKPGVDLLAQSIDIFGRGAGPKLLPLLKKGASGIEELRAEAQKLGVVIDEDGIEKAEEFEIAQKKMGATLKGIRNEAVVALLPALQEMAEGLQKWIMANRDAIVSGLETFFGVLASAMHVVGEVLSWLIDLFKNHTDAVVSLGLAFVVMQYQAISAAVASAAAWVIAALPFVAIAAAIAAVIFVLKKLLEHVIGAKVTWTELWNAVIEAGEMIIDWFEALYDKVEPWISNVVDSIEQAFSDLWQSVKDGAQEAWDDIKGIPVIGHVIRGVQAVGEGIGDAAGWVATQGGTYDPTAPKTVPAAGEERGDVTIQGGDTHIEINGTNLDHKQLKSAVQDAINESNKDMLRHAHDSISGGKR